MTLIHNPHSYNVYCDLLGEHLEPHETCEVELSAGDVKRAEEASGPFVVMDLPKRKGKRDASPDEGSPQA